MNEKTQLIINFKDNKLLPMVYGIHNQNLKTIQNAIGVNLHNRGNVITISGKENDIAKAESVLNFIYQNAKEGKDITEEIILSLIEAPIEAPKVSTSNKTNAPQITIGKKAIVARGKAQIQYYENMQNYEICFGVGPAGTGKTHLAVCYGASLLLAGEVERLVITRPAVEAGESLGFLPGDLEEKFDPYLRPIYDALQAILTESQITKLRTNGAIEIAPLAYMRGRTLAHSFIMLDEAQNTTTLQMKMFLTRLGAKSRMVITGDPTQIDLNHNQKSGLLQAIEVLSNIQDIAFSKFTNNDIVRHPLVNKIVQAYDKHHNA